MTGDNPERLVKSSERVRDLGEVFTPAATVNEMLDLLPDSIWEPHPSATFLEPSCGDGNFLVAVLDRKLRRVHDQHAAGTLAGGSDDTAAEFHFLEALASIYAIDISIDNIVGGTPGHEVGARDRVLDTFGGWYQKTTGRRPHTRSRLAASARWIVDHNIQVGNMLAFDTYGRPTGRDRIPLVDYTWDLSGLTVTVTPTTLGAVMRANAVGALTFDFDPQPTAVWTGPASDMRAAPIPLPDVPTGTARNSKR